MLASLYEASRPVGLASEEKPVEDMLMMSQ
jgi:hypothetical protein